MKYAIDQINDNKSILPGLKLGYALYDICEVNEFRQILLNLVKNTTLGVIGPTKGSDVSLAAVVTSLYDRTMIAFNWEHLDIDLRSNFKIYSELYR